MPGRGGLAPFPPNSRSRRSASHTLSPAFFPRAPRLGSIRRLPCSTNSAQKVQCRRGVPCRVAPSFALLTILIVAFVAAVPTLWRVPSAPALLAWQATGSTVSPAQAAPFIGDWGVNPCSVGFVPLQSASSLPRYIGPLTMAITRRPSRFRTAPPVRRAQPVEATAS